MSTVMKQSWHHKDCACCVPVTTCLLAYCFPCILYGRTRHRIQNQGNMDGYSCCNIDCLGQYGLGLLGIWFVLPMINRGDMRARYRLKGNGCKDCMCACCCVVCDLVQQDKEAKYRESQARPWGLQPGLDGQMEYKPQQQDPAFHHG